MHTCLSQSDALSLWLGTICSYSNVSYQGKLAHVVAEVSFPF
jgi:hypothetical protein